MTKVLRICGTRKILGNKKRFDKELDKFKDMQIDFVSYLDYYYDGKFKNIETWLELSDYNLYRISGWIGTKWFWFRAGLNYYFWELKKKKILDPINYNITDTSKFQQLLFFNHYDYGTPKTLFFQITQIHKDKYVQITKETFSYPVIIKDLYKDRWKWVFIVRNDEELIKKIEEFDKIWMLVQEYIENQWEFRVLIIWNKIAWIFKRHNPGHYRNNVIKWAMFENIWISKEMEDKMIEITKKYWLDFAWIDLIIKDDKYYIFEINSAPQFKRLEEITWKNIAYQLLEYFSTNP